jgi:hypothetical protein
MHVILPSSQAVEQPFFGFAHTAWGGKFIHTGADTFHEP